MKRAIVIPTFIKHFNYIENLLDSIKKFVSDKKDIDIVFILSDKKEENDFLVKFNNYFKILNIKTENIDNIVSGYCSDFKSEKYIKKLGKHSYQTIKKLYAADYLDYEQILIIDSESLFFKEVNVNSLFDEYFSNPYIMYSKNLENDKNCLSDETDLNFFAHRNSSELFHKTPGNMWYFEAFHWFYDKKIIRDLFNYFDNKLFERILEISEKYEPSFEKATFEPEIYYIWINEVCKNKYNYLLVDTKEEIKNILGGGYTNILIPRLYKYKYVSVPFFQHGFECLNINDLEKFTSLYKKYKLRIARLNLRPLKKSVIYKFLLSADIVLGVSTDNIFEYNNILNINFIHKLLYKFEYMIDCLLRRKILKLVQFKAIIRFIIRKISLFINTKK